MWDDSGNGIRQKLNRNETERQQERDGAAKGEGRGHEERSGTIRCETFNVKITEEQRKTQIGTEMI